MSQIQGVENTRKQMFQFLKNFLNENIRQIRDKEPKDWKRFKKYVNHSQNMDFIWSPIQTNKKSG